MCQSTRASLQRTAKRGGKLDQQADSCRWWPNQLNLETKSTHFWARTSADLSQRIKFGTRRLAIRLGGVLKGFARTLTESLSKFDLE